MSNAVCLKHVEKGDYAYEEAIKTLRTNIQFCGSNLKTVMFTSSMPDEGKSEIVMALAVSLASIGKKVLLVDADIRKSVLITRHGVRGRINGLSQYLSGQKTMEEILYHTNIEGMDIVFAGPYSPNPAELLEENSFKELIRATREDYDYLLIDTPPMAGPIDGAIVAGLCDGAVIVIESGAISRRLVQRVKAQLEKSGCRILGVVLNRMDTSRDRYYGKYGKYNSYKRDAYEQYYEKKKE